MRFEYCHPTELISGEMFDNAYKEKSNHLPHTIKNIFANATNLE